MSIIGWTQDVGRLSKTLHTAREARSPLAISSAMNTDNTPENVYARELGKRGQGYPLWVPEPQDVGEVEIGDVGYIRRGGFYRLFRATEDGTDDSNRTHGVPEKFEKFSIGNLAPKRLDNVIPKGLLGSQSVKHLAIDGQVTAAELVFKCEVTDDQGAFLALGSPATRQELRQIRTMKTHMGRHVRNWYTFACEMGLEIAEEDIIFVRGWVKTTGWVVAAFTQRGKGAQISISADCGAVASGHLRFEATHKSSPTYDYRSGPESQKTLNNQKNRGGGKQGNSKGKGRARHQESNLAQPETNQALAMNQCVFLHYLKLKRRFLGMKFMEAMAEPRDPSFEGDDHHFEQVPAPVKRYDPVDYLLDYILEVCRMELLAFMLMTKHFIELFC
ncbi:uncharacterized protein LAESUDRAFT_560651 [Laetiporus sulphureus 93-53]|uniref:Uncharacterized protein n=1 Tax=Laetiporus sulphureus 93-53 TaxID=1314785 RepID=A0A165B4R1_9APHY|nr:uncharacterized protein LAESUDRAFT_560651 [Laetiporus sulphureus 93-53]KZT00234.1 hypothetical protein LAESUDRAFT_560651 [Laetiporus sulphureus 93-53]